MTAARLAARRLASQQSFYRLLGGVELDGGIVAGVVPAAPDRSMVNAVVYADSRALVAAIPRLTELYADAGVRAWTVWVPEDDRSVAEALAAAGHRLDGTPTAMAADLGEMALDGPVPDGVEEVGWTEIAALNDSAYPFPDGAFHAMLGHLDDAAPAYRYAVPGRACVMAEDTAGDCGIACVATHPEHRGRGLCAGLLRHALREAAGRGCTTTSLEATRAGRPAYERLGYRPLGTLQMWERRAGVTTS